ncbi:MAG: 50S ribosome-binding GTPase, partial [Chloroflexi bacterium]|nr:50S ribosome-binding GTPase [Chloroflexota bacterium]
MRFALVGRPNCGKSTLFNQVAGYKAETGNFHGTTVTFTESKVRVVGDVVNLVDLPGTYTLAGSNPAEAVAMDYLASNDVDVIINVADASHLAQSLELTLELLTVKRPVILALNMMDEAMRLGLKVDGPGLEKKLGIRVLPLVASKGRGIKGLFLAGKDAAGALPNYEARFQAGEADALARHRLGQELAEEFVSQGARNLTLR